MPDFGPRMFKRETTVNLTDGKTVMVPDIDLTIWFDGECEQDGDDTFWEITHIEIDGNAVQDGNFLKALEADIYAQCREEFDDAIYAEYRQERYERHPHRPNAWREYA